MTPPGQKTTIVSARIANVLADLESLFVKGVELTLIARFPGYPERDLVVSSDTAQGVLEAAERMVARDLAAQEEEP